MRRAFDKIRLGWVAFCVVASLVVDAVKESYR